MKKQIGGKFCALLIAGELYFKQNYDFIIISKRNYSFDVAGKFKPIKKENSLKIRHVRSSSSEK